MTTTAGPIVVRDPAKMADTIAHIDGKTVALVPTMGALHAGHLSLIELAKQSADIVVVSIFVNPTQFGAGEDYEEYPRTEAADLAALTSAGADIAFVPSAKAMYPQPDEVTVNPGPVGSWYEGKTRPRHFAGALTVVNKLINIVRPDVAVFGQKDAQQVYLVKTMVRDMHHRTRIVVAPILRDTDELAMSSRNKYLGRDERQAAPTLYRALREASEFAPLGIDAAVRAAQGIMMAESLAKLDYLVIVDPDNFQPVGDDYHGEALAIGAATFGDTRIIDNVSLSFP